MSVRKSPSSKLLQGVPCIDSTGEGASYTKQRVQSAYLFQSSAVCMFAYLYREEEDGEEEEEEEDGNEEDA